jgi:hypothetical protein
MLRRLALPAATGCGAAWPRVPRGQCGRRLEASPLDGTGRGAASSLRLATGQSEYAPGGQPLRGSLYGAASTGAGSTVQAL